MDNEIEVDSSQVNLVIPIKTQNTRRPQEKVHRFNSPVKRENTVYGFPIPSLTALLQNSSDF